VRRLPAMSTNAGRSEARNHLSMTIWNSHVGNILTVFAHSDTLDRDAGMNAYENYQRKLAGYGRNFGFNITTSCGVFAALSPNLDEKNNFIALERILANDEGFIPGYPLNHEKARRIRDGAAPLDILHGPKTRAFFCNLADPEGSEVTIDGHMYSVWHLKRFTMSKAHINTQRQYDRIAADFRTAAKVVGIRANQMQAVCWFTWKRRNRIVFNPKLHQLPLAF
jgi:hypothetical protein